MLGGGVLGVRVRGCVRGGGCVRGMLREVGVL